MKFRLSTPELSWREETVDVPKGRTGALRETLRAQQERINRQLSRRNEEAVRELDAAAKSSDTPVNSRLLALGVLLGLAAGLLLAPTRGKDARAKLGQVASRAGRAKAARSETGGGGEQETAPETVSQ